MKRKAPVKRIVNYDSFKDKFESYIDNVGEILDLCPMTEADRKAVSDFDKMILADLKEEEMTGGALMTLLKNDDGLLDVVALEFVSVASEDQIEKMLEECDKHQQYQRIEIYSLAEQIKFEEFRQKLYDERN